MSCSSTNRQDSTEHSTYSWILSRMRDGAPASRREQRRTRVSALCFTTCTSVVAVWRVQAIKVRTRGCTVYAETEDVGTMRGGSDLTCRAARRARAKR